MMWRVGGKVPLNVYDGDRPVCQCHKAEDAELIVAAVNQLPMDQEMAERLIHRTLQLEEAIQKHRDARGHDRCWLNDRELYAALDDATVDQTLPPLCEFLHECTLYWGRSQPPPGPDFIGPDGDPGTRENENGK